MDYLTPYAGYNAYQPATVAQLERLRHWTCRIAERCNDMLDDLSRLDDADKTITDEINAIKAMAESLAGRLDAVENRLPGIDNRIDGLAADVNTLKQRLDDMDARGYVIDVQYTPTDDGVDITAIGTLHTNHHQIGVTGDAYTMVRSTHGDASTQYTITGKGGLGDPARIAMGKPDGIGMRLTAPDGTVIGETTVTSSDDTLALAQTGTSIDMTAGKGLTSRLNGLDGRISDVDRAHNRRPTLDDIGTSVGAHGVDTTYTWRTADGSKVRKLTITSDIETDDTITAGTTTVAGGSRLDLSALPVLGRLPLLESTDKLGVDDTGITLSHKVYHPQTGVVSDDGTDTVPVSTDDTMTVDLTDGIRLSAAPAVDKARQMDAAQLDTVKSLIREQADRIDSLVHTVSDLQTKVAQAQQTADSSVTNATMTLTGEEDDGATVTISLLSRTGVEVARLPVTLRVKSTNGTVKAGVQTNGNVATLAIDVI